MNDNSKAAVASQSLCYQGFVTVQLRHGKRAYRTIECHNEGHAELFKFLAHCLISQYEQSERPKFLMLYNHIDNNGIETTTPVTSSLTPHNSVRVVKGDGYYDAVFEFLVPYGSLIGTRVNMLKIFSQENAANPLPDKASVTVLLTGDDVFVVGDTKTNILVTWTMRITNVPNA